MKVKIISAIVFLCGAVSLVVGNILPEVLLKTYADAKGISMFIDAEKSVYSIRIKFFISDWYCFFLCLGVALILTALFCFAFTKTARTVCGLATSAISLSLSAVGGAGLYCILVCLETAVFDDAHKYPITYPTSAILVIFCLVAFVALTALYLKIRQKHRSIKGFVIDIFTSVIYLPAVFFACSLLHKLIDL